MAVEAEWVQLRGRGGNMGERPEGGKDIGERPERPEGRENMGNSADAL